MRIPGIKIWRAFEELDHMSDDECRSLLRRAYLQVSPWRFRFAAGVAVMVGTIATAALGVVLRDMFRHENTIAVAVVLHACVLVASIAILHLVARDINLYLLIRKDLSRASCPKCRQSLIGLPVTQSALHPGTPGDARVRCTECGRVWVLLEIGLTARDLIPFEERVPDAQIGTIRRGSNWKGRRG